MITVTFVGRVHEGAELKNVGGSTVLEFRGYSSRKEKGNKVFDNLRFSYWGKAGEAVAKYLEKGKQVSITGELALREYTGKDGAKKTSPEVRVLSLELLGGGDQASTNGAGARNAAGATRGYETSATEDDTSFDPDTF